MIDQFSTLFTHTDATAYTRDGRIVVSDTTGLSAYLQVVHVSPRASLPSFTSSLLLPSLATPSLPLSFLHPATPAPMAPDVPSPLADGWLCSTLLPLHRARPQWLKEDILSDYGPLKAELEDQSKFKQKDVERLYKAIEEGEQVVQSAWRKPGSALRVTQKKMMEIDKLLAKLVTRENASEELFAQCFPDTVLVDQYKKQQEEKKAEAAELHHS